MSLDPRPRCHWPKDDPLYVTYHDVEWGVPEFDPRALWEKLVLDGFQAGLSWITILRKREAMRAAFSGFDPETVARFSESDKARLMADPGIIRSGAKIEAAIKGARLWLDLRAQGKDFATVIWEDQGFQPQCNHFALPSDVPAETPASIALSKKLKGLGFSFCGPVITYAFMQATGLVNDHLTTCFRHVQVTHLGGAPEAHRDCL